ncbi:hypothetical protein GOODEAATRI_004503 [Goodea atripinnis]|uniref:Uncharacterized protein n=1 Tax=Goodea atripinnis TaxID=208336 RepID=A0ABV0MYV1_9TELE
MLQSHTCFPEAEGKNETLKCQGDKKIKNKKDIWLNYFPPVPHIQGNPDEKRRGRPFVKVSLRPGALGEKYNQTMKELHKEPGSQDYFYSPSPPTFTPQTKHEMTII